MAAIRSDIDSLEQVEDATEDDHLRLDALLQEWDELTTEIEPLEEREQKIAQVRSRSQNAGNVDEPSVIDGAPDLVVRKQKRDPFADLDSVRTHMMPINEVRSRAASAVEAYASRDDHWALDDDAAENVTELIYKRGKNFGKAISEQILVTGAPEYLAAFEQYLSDPGGFSTRAALSLTPANGGYLVPFTLDPTIILTNAGSANPYRAVRERQDHHDERLERRHVGGCLR
jgi:hypothetical protein